MSFEATLKDKIKRIFDLDKVSYDAISESQEQECTFIQIKEARVRVQDAKEVGMIKGRLLFFSNSEKMPLDYFAKQIEKANVDAKDLFFEPVEHIGTLRNISERSINFTYLYDQQYDPNQGTLNELTLETN